MDFDWSYILTTSKNSVAWVASELYPPSDRHLSAKLVPTFTNSIKRSEYQAQNVWVHKKNISWRRSFLQARKCKETGS
jgi:hypothetical protein